VKKIKIVVKWLEFVLFGKVCAKFKPMGIYYSAFAFRPRSGLEPKPD
jgi:hypothetical protein